MESIDKAGYEAVFATPKGQRPQALPPSMDSKFIDPPLGRSVVTEEMAKKVKALDQSSRLDNILNITMIMPERPYLSENNYLAKLEAYYHNLESVEKNLSEYVALLLVGGSGPIIDMVNNQRIHDIILSFLRRNKPIAAECYGITCLAFARDIRQRKSIIWGKHVTGHPLEYDYI